MPGVHSGLHAAMLCGAVIYHLTTRMDWQRSQGAGEYRSPTFEEEGFIHCSTREQVLPVANAFFKGQSGLLLLAIEEGRLKSELKYEAPVHPGGKSGEGVPESQRFPHLYGPLNLDAVVAVHPLPVEGDAFVWPEGL